MLPAFQTELPEQFGNAIMQSLPRRPYTPPKNSRFCRTSRLPYRENFCATYPRCSRACALALRRSTPATRSMPPLAGRRPHSMRKVVVFPAPFGPSRPKSSPRAHAETGVVHRNKVSETAHQIAHLNYGFPIRDFFQRAFAPGKGGQRLFKRELLFCIPSLPEYDHETVLESGRNGRCFPSAAARGLFPSLRFREDFFF